jgi:hypothetical protein
MIVLKSFQFELFITLIFAYVFIVPLLLGFFAFFLKKYASQRITYFASA